MRYYCFAGSRLEADYLRKTLALDDFHYITDRNSFQGAISGVLLLYGTYYYVRENLNEILHEAGRRNMRILKVQDL